MWLFLRYNITVVRFIMKKEIKCYRCGNAIEINPKNLSQQVTCHHCQGKMDLDKKTKREFTIIRYIFIILMSLLLVTLIFLVTRSTVMIVALTILLAFGLSSLSDTVALWLTYMLFGLSYEHIEVDKKQKKNNKKK